MVEPRLLGGKLNWVPVLKNELKSLHKGTVKRWFIRRGYGFIDVNGEDRDIFVHFSDVKGRPSLRIDERVEFDIIETYQGSRAVNVQPISE